MEGRASLGKLGPVGVVDNTVIVEDIKAAAQGRALVFFAGYVDSVCVCVGGLLMLHTTPICDVMRF